ncbi:hypothetical protein B6U80_00520 [Candidatus Pacearchaeota archaeon ex4484_26]|nr:MAG: hypothetical protein B6U80_00520 [Candidatus Pacearchaeota archaeon ex4484_26]
MDLQNEEQQQEYLHSLGWENKEAFIIELNEILSKYFESTKGKKLKKVTNIHLSKKARTISEVKSTKSETYKLIVEVLREGEGSTRNQLFFIKKYLDWARDTSKVKPTNEFKEFLKKLPFLHYFVGTPDLPGMTPTKDIYNLEKALLDVTTEKGKEIRKSVEKHIHLDEKIQIFPALISKDSKEFDERNILLLQLIYKNSLEEKLLTDQKVDWREITHFLFPILALHQELPKYEKEINLRLNPNGKSHLKLERIGKKYYLDHFLLYLDIIKNKDNLIANNTFEELPPSSKQELKELFLNIAKPLLEPKYPQMITLIQKDGYPWHTTPICLFDAGGIVYGHRGFHLGSLLGNPRVYFNLENRDVAIKELAKTYREKWISFDPSIKEISRDSLINEFLSVNYMGAIQDNLKFVAGKIVEIAKKANEARSIGKTYNTPESDEKVIKEYLKATSDQLEYFGDNGKNLSAKLQGLNILTGTPEYNNAYIGV